MLAIQWAAGFKRYTQACKRDQGTVMLKICSVGQSISNYLTWVVRPMFRMVVKYIDPVSLVAARASPSQILTLRPMCVEMACKQNLEFEMCFDIGSQHLGCWGQNTSRIQNKEVYATFTLHLQARARPTSR